MSFLNPFFLIALGAALVPVVLHLVRKVQAKKVQFPSLMFLQATPHERVRKRRLRDVLLMATRAFLLLLLALVFARPFVPDEAVPFLSGEENESVVLLVDRSMSMQYADRFGEARQAALDRLEGAARGDEFAVVAFADDVQQLTALGDDPAIHQQVLQNLEPSYRPTDFYNALRRAEEILADARHERRTVVLVSDLQRNAWVGAFENWKLAREVAFEPIQVGDGTADNAALAEVTLTPQRRGADLAMRFDARVQAVGTRAAARPEASLVLEATTTATHTLAPLPTQTLTFQHRHDRAGRYQGALALAPDALPADDQYFVSYEMADRPALLFLDDGPRGSRRDAFFVGRAFDLGEESLYRFTAANRSRLTRAGLRDQAVVFLANVSTVTAGQVATLRQYVEDGGALVVSFGPNTNLGAFSTLLEDLGVGTVAARVSARASQGFDAIIGEVDLRHPVFSLFADAGSGVIFRPKFRQYVRLAPDSSAAVLGRYDSGDVFLAEQTVGRGRVLVYTSTFGPAWTDFPVQELYVPFLYQLTQHAVRRAEAQQQYTVGDAVALRGAPGTTWDVRTPDARVVKLDAEADGTAYFRDTEQPGHYQATDGRTAFPFAVNVDPVESDLAARDEAEAYAAVVPPTEDAPTDPAAASLASLEAEEARQKFWRVLLLFVLAVFAFETYYANRRVATS